MLRKLCLLPLVGLSIAPATASEERAAFVESNVVAILYHELAHAVIHLMNVPIFGQEEGAADVMAVLMIDMIFDDASARAIAYDSAFGYLEDIEGEEEIAWWDTHGPDLQRYFNHVCLFYGAEPESREDLAEELGLPEERAESCPDEYQLAADSWGGIFEELSATTTGSLVFIDKSEGEQNQISALLASEINDLNADFGLPENVEVRFEPCGEPNAFYDLEDIAITFCTEFVGSLEGLYDALGGG